MIRGILFGTLAVVAGSAVVANAAPKDDLMAAAKKLADAPSYSWKSNVENGGGGGFGGGPSEGKTEKDGFTMTSRTMGDNTIETVMKGEKRATKNQEGQWMTPEEMAAAGGGAGGGRGRGRGGFGGAAQLPAAQLQDMLSKAKDVTKSADAYVVTFDEAAAKTMVNPFGGGRGGRGGPGGAAPGGAAPGGAGGQGPEVANAKATARVWVKDGVVSKYETVVSGNMSFGGNDMEINRTTTIDIKDVGSTKVTVPDDVKKKLS